MSREKTPTGEFEISSEDLSLAKDLEPLDMDVAFGDHVTIPGASTESLRTDRPVQRAKREKDERQKPMRDGIESDDDFIEVISDDEAAQPVEPPRRKGHPTVKFGRYALKDRIAVGGMAEVFLAGIKGPGGFSKACVVKRILPEYAGSPEFAQMLANEARISAMLSHQNIVQVFDYGAIDGDYFIAMEFIDGCSLEVLLRHAMKRRGSLGVRIAVQVISAVADALHYAHSLRLPEQELKIVHRDVAPGNILISHAGHVKLADFGVVKSTINRNQTEAGVLKGKFGYMSPEQVRAGPLDNRSDIFSLGIILWELCVGRWLFRSEHVTETISAVAQAKVRDPASLLENFPSDLNAIIMKALAKDVADRYQTAGDLKADLDTFRVRQQWTSGDSEVAAYMAQVFPAGLGAEAAYATPISSPTGNGIPGINTLLADTPPGLDSSPGSAGSAGSHAIAANANAAERQGSILFRSGTVLACSAASFMFWWAILGA